MDKVVNTIKTIKLVKKHKKSDSDYLLLKVEILNDRVQEFILWKLGEEGIYNHFINMSSEEFMSVLELFVEMKSILITEYGVKVNDK